METDISLKCDTPLSEMEQYVRGLTPTFYILRALILLCVDGMLVNIDIKVL